MKLREKIDSMMKRIDEDLYPFTSSDDNWDELRQLIRNAVEMEFEDWETEIACAVYDPQRD